MPASNFDRATAFHHRSCDLAPPKRYMTLREFHDYVCLDAPDVRAGSATTEGVVRRCYGDISFFDLAKEAAYLQARDCARAEVRARLARVDALVRAARSAAPATRGGVTPSMHDRRRGADDSGEEGGGID